ncbi:hypothetical protein [Neisseria sp.]|uniref:hypothetical protein n=1 Tax=Neisseria sp. TaxID=192066 RepID=UPI0035A0EE56
MDIVLILGFRYSYAGGNPFFIFSSDCLKKGCRISSMGFRLRANEGSGKKTILPLCYQHYPNTAYLKAFGQPSQSCMSYQYYPNTAYLKEAEPPVTNHMRYGMAAIRRVNCFSDGTKLSGYGQAV